MAAPQGQSTTYAGNQADGDAIQFNGNFYGPVHFPERPREAGDPSPHQCLRDLRVTDPREDRARIEGDKDRLLRDCYKWVLEDDSYQRWKTQDASRLLWIKGEPGKGKTMMTMGVIAELSRKDEVKRSIWNVMGRLWPVSGPCLVAYFFCQSARPELNNATSVLRGLIYLLIAQRGELIQHVQRRYETMGKQLFEGPNAVAVAVFVEYKVQRLATVEKYDLGLQAEVQLQLHDRAEGSFLWVSLVCKELEGVPLYSTREVLQALPPGLDPLYNRMMAQIVAQDARTAKYCKEVLRIIALSFRPLQLRELAVAAGLPKDYFGDVQAVADLASRCGSFLTVREGIVSFIHLSAKDYFTVGNGKQVFDGPLAEEQGRLTNSLLTTMDSTLRRDICDLQKPGTRIQDVVDSVKCSNLPQIAYACEHWVDHLEACAENGVDILLDSGDVHIYLQTHLLHWLEAMSLLQKMPEAVTALQKLQSMLSVSRNLTRRQCGD
ncbi:hypothetical protein CUC08_Gglean011896 [Alternaria sp. MG1]|nr:hypothetical protein CUC08_Gglean011896 [Alternaria sp. MG1]